MNRKNTPELLTLSDAAVKFANLESVEPWEFVEDVFKNQAGAIGPLRHRIGDEDRLGFVSLIDLRDNAEEWLDGLIKGGKRRREVFQELVDQIPHASAQIELMRGDPASSVFVRTGNKEPLPFLPRFEIIKGELIMKPQWLFYGVHSRVIFGLIELVINGRITRLARCKQCQKFYFKAGKRPVEYCVNCYLEYRKKGSRELMRSLRQRRRSSARQHSRRRESRRQRP